MPVFWDDDAWDDYLDWQDVDKKTLKKINRLLKSIARDEKPIGKAERLKHSLAGACSVRIDDKNHLVYRVEDGVTYVLSCKGHYEE